MNLFSDAYIQQDEKTNGNASFNVIRKVYQQEDINREAEYHKPKTPITKRLRQALTASGFNSCASFLKNTFPIISWLSSYNWKKDIISDIIPGFTVGIMHIPQGMAYGLLCEVSPIVGLYMAFFPVLVYVFLGTSRHVSIGTFAVICLMAGKIVTTYSNEELITDIVNSTATGAVDTGEVVSGFTRAEVLSAVCMMVGLYQVLMWICQMGVISSLLSDPLVSGFTTGAAMHVMASQTQHLFGVVIKNHKGMFKVVLTVVDICKLIPNSNWIAVVMALTTIVVIYINNDLLKPWLSKKCRVPVPMELIAIIIGTLASRFMNLHEIHNVTIVGTVSTGLPAPRLPPFILFSDIALEAFTIAMVSYTVTMSMGLMFAQKEKYEVNSNQEFLALGAGNVVGSIFACGPVCASLARSYIQWQTGGKTQLTSIVSSGLILCVLLWIGPFFEQLPKSVLAGIILISLKGMILQTRDLLRFWRFSKLDGSVWLITFLIVVFIDIDIGLVAGVIASISTLFLREQNAYTCLLGRMPNTNIYLDVKRYRAAEELPGFKIFHYCGSINFASKNMFKSTLYRKVGLSADPDKADGDSDTIVRPESSSWDSKIQPTIRCVILDFTALSYIDSQGIQAVRSVHQDLENQTIRVLVAGANSPVLETITRYNLRQADKLEVEMFPTVHDAIVYFQASGGDVSGNITIKS